MNSQILSPFLQMYIQAQRIQCLIIRDENTGQRSTAFSFQVLLKFVISQL